MESSVSSNTRVVGADNSKEDVFSLVQRAKSGDLSAFDSLMVRYRQRLVRCDLQYDNECGRCRRPDSGIIC